MAPANFASTRSHVGRERTLPTKQSVGEANAANVELLDSLEDGDVVGGPAPLILKRFRWPGVLAHAHEESWEDQEKHDDRLALAT